MLIDTHCHLNFKAFENDLPDVVRRAKEAGVEKIIIPGTDIASSTRAIQIAQEFPGCFAAIGIHPHHAKDTTLIVNNDLKQQLKKLATQNRVVALGEIGIDYHVYGKTKYEHVEITEEYKQKQKELLALQMEIAQELQLPMILHCRDAHDDMIQTISSFVRPRRTTNDTSNFSRIPIPSLDSREILPNEAVKQPQDYINQHQENSLTTFPPGVFHCWGGSKHHLRLIIAMGYYVGFDGNITYSSDYSTLVATAPLDRILLETDSPYLTPIPHRGKRNEPMHLPLIAQQIAKYHSSTPKEVIHLSTKNAKRLFQI